MMPTLETERLLLRPFREEDAPAVHEHCENWNIARMLTRIPHPYSRDIAARWIASHAAEWRSGDEHTFCIEFDGKTVGAIGLRRISAATYELGYWLGEPFWGKGIATEATRRTMGYAFEELGAENLSSGHYVDNPASGRVLEKCGFRYTRDSMVPCDARGETVAHRNYEYKRNEIADQAERS
ncbi:MAG: GNAT family N-acetyltransferase [Proteobacteria bacterium]|nr:GNAT family N-acetyltransferase [Pseudomonadota bacterium]